MQKFLIFVLIFLVTLEAWACPGCQGGVSANRKEYTFIILGAFIGLCYIPMYLMYKNVKNFDVNKNNNV